jgi:hypothetical protein
MGALGATRARASREETVRDRYLALRRQYEPRHVGLLIVAESPPASGLYFYDATGRATEPLFAALMQQAGISCTTKEKGLLGFRRRGWSLVDATYQPVNQHSASRRDEIIENDYPALRGDLTRLTHDQSTPVILVKANVCRLLEAKLVQDGFDVLNRGVAIPFPSTGRQRQFREQFAAVLHSAGISQNDVPLPEDRNRKS